jgi:hypothetical protein
MIINAFMYVEHLNSLSLEHHNVARKRTKKSSSFICDSVHGVPEQVVHADDRSNVPKP